jgi:hypothetical protein
VVFRSGLILRQRKVWLELFWLKETDGNEYIVAYESRILLDAETRYTFIEKLCLSLCHACTKLRHYLLSSTYYVACQTDIIKYILQKPIPSGRVGKWVYTLVEYDLHCEPIKSMRGRSQLYYGT